MSQPSVFEFAGGERAFRRLAAAHHRRCLEDPVLNHPFSHPGEPDHIERLAAYWAEVFGGPPRYSDEFGGHSGMLAVHAGIGEVDEDLGDHFVSCFVRAADDADLRAILRSAMPCAPTWSGPSPRRSTTRRRARRYRPACRSRTGAGRASRMQISGKDESRESRQALGPP